MRILIAYTSKTGTTAECAEILANRLRDGNEVVVSDMKKEETLPASNFDAIVLGSSIRMGRVSKEVKNYIKSNGEALSKIPCAVFLCCGLPDEFEEYVTREFSADFAPSYGFHCFGGELKPKKARGLDRIVLKAMRRSITEHDFEDGNYKGALPEIIPEHIYILADKIMGR